MWALCSFDEKSFFPYPGVYLERMVRPGTEVREAAFAKTANLSLTDRWLYVCAIGCPGISELPQDHAMHLFNLSLPVGCKKCNVPGSVDEAFPAAGRGPNQVDCNVPCADRRGRPRAKVQLSTHPVQRSLKIVEPRALIVQQGPDFWTRLEDKGTEVTKPLNMAGVGGR